VEDQAKIEQMNWSVILNQTLQEVRVGQTTKTGNNRNMKCSQTTGTVFIFFNIATQLDLHVYVYIYIHLYTGMQSMFIVTMSTRLYMTKFVSELTPVEVSRWFYSATIVSNPRARLITL
jgi:hypothetical protein